MIPFSGKSAACNGRRFSCEIRNDARRRIGRMALFCAAVFSRDGALRGGFLHRRGVHSNSPFNAPVLLTIKQAWQTMDCLRILSADDLLVMNNKVSLSDKFSLFNDHWNPRIVGQLKWATSQAGQISGRIRLTSSRAGRRNVSGRQRTLSHGFPRSSRMD
jgi:hypothetical protein